MLPGILIGYALNSGGGWTGDLIIADWIHTENYVASEVHARRFESKVVGIKYSKDIFLCSHGSLRQESHTQPQTLRRQRVERFDPVKVPSTFVGRGEARSDPLQCARSDSLQEEGVADVSELDRDAMEALEDFQFLFL